MPADIHSFYLFLLLFYFADCLKFTPLGSFAMAGSTFRTDRWRPRVEFLRLMGVRRAVFLAPLLPWPFLIAITPGGGEKAHADADAKTVAEVRYRMSALIRGTSHLRLFSFLVWAHFFIFLPLVYRRFGIDTQLYSAVFLGFGFQAVTALLFFRAHRKRSRNESLERLKNTFFTCLLPWFAMRCADEILTKESARWSRLALLATNAGNRESRAELLRLWRQAEYLRRPAYSHAVLRPLFSEIGLDEAEAFEKPACIAGKKYCPCCFVTYTPETTVCADCEGLRLEGPDS